jgi:alcohol dehydrogenase (NADP+)
MPTVGFGTWMIKERGPMYTAIANAGYRHIDCAKIYGNEKEVGEDLAQVFSEGKCKREELFVTTKLWHDDYADPEAALRSQLKNLQMDYVDLYIIHWPIGYFQGKVPLHVLWPKLEKLVELGLTKAIGVSNFNIQLLADLLTYAKIRPQCNQIELNPLVPQTEMVKFLKKEGIVTVAYTPTSKPLVHEERGIKKGYVDMRTNEYMLSLCEKYKKSVVQIMLNWGLRRGHVVIPKACTYKY